MNSTNKVWFGFTYSCVPKFLLIAIFAIYIYIPQYDKHVNREFSLKNVGFFIAANVWGMAIHKLTSNVIHVYISKCHRSRSAKEAFKWTRTELHFEVKLLSRGKVIHIPYKIHMHMFLCDSTCNCKHHLKKFQVTSERLNTKGVTKQIKYPRCFMPVTSMKIHICPKLNIFFFFFFNFM